jgi:mannosyltransferase
VRSRQAEGWATLIILLAGVGLRLWWSGYHGLEGDDAFSLSLSQYPVTALVRGLFRLELDIHPPLHFLLVKGWVALTGESLLALRLLNVLLDTLTGALLVGLSQQVGRGRQAWIVALLWALNPLLIMGGWLVRMYILLGTLATAAAWAALRATSQRDMRWGWAIVAVGVALAALYTHITGTIIFGYTAAILIGHAYRRSWSALGGVALLLAGVMLAYLPFLWPILRLYTSDTALGAAVNPANAVTWWAVPASVLKDAYAFRVGVSMWAILAGAALLVLYDLSVAFRPRKPAQIGGLRTAPGLIQLGGGIPWRVYLVVSVAYVGLVILGVAAGLYKPRYVVPFAPLLLLPVAWGAGRLLSRDRASGGVMLLVLLITMGAGQRALLARDWRDDWTAAAAYIQDHTLPGDVVLVVPDWGQEALRYHYDGAAPVRGFFPQVGPGLDLDAAFGPYIAEAGRVWVVRYQPSVSDPDDRALKWFEERCAPAAQVFPAGMQIRLYDCDRSQATIPAVAQPVNIEFGGALGLRGVFVPRQTTAATDARLYDESGRVLVTLYWEALRPGLDVIPRVQLTTPGGAVYGAALPDPAAQAVSTWQPGEVITAYYDLNLNPTTPPGLYNLEVMVLGTDAAPLAAVGAGAGARWYIAGQVVVSP